MHKNTKIQLGHLTLLVAALMQAGVVHAGFNFAPGLQLNTSAPITSLTGICSPSTNPSSTQTALCSVSAPTPTSVTISGPVQVPNTAPTRAGIAVNGDTSVINTVNLTAATIKGGSAAGGVVIANTASNVTLNIANDTSITVLSKSLGTGAAGLVGTNFTAVNNGQVTGGRVDGGFAYTQGAVGVNNDGVTPALGSGATGGAGTLGGSGGSGVSGTSTTGMGGAGIDGSGATLTNTGTITGGQAGAGGRAGRGGSAVGGDGGTGANAMPDVVNGMGGVGGQGGAGGVGGSGGTGGVGSTGGAGVTGNGFSLNNSGTITGAYSGYGGRSATGGDAESGQGGKGGNASVSTGTMNPASGAGGKGGDGGTGGIGGAGGSGGNDGIGGAGVSGTGFVVTNSGTITGGMGYKGNYGQTGGSASSRGGGFGGLGSNGPGTSGGAGGDGGAGGKGGTGGVGGNGGVGGTGGAGVTGTNFTLTNTGTITGGKGGYTRQGGNGGTANGGYGGNGGNGYFGADPTNPAVASGGRGGNGGMGGDGGTGGAGGIGGVGGTGGAGVSGSGFTLTNSGSIVGGAGNTGGIGRNGGSADGYRGGAGGATLNGSLAPFNMGGTAGNGGAGGNGGNGGIGGAGGAGGAGGSGGAGVSGASFTLANTGVIKGGNGAVGGTGGAGGTAAAGSGGLGSTTFAAGYASGNAGTSGTAGTAGAAGVAGAFGAGGVGVVSTGNSTVTNSGTISGGLAGDGTTLADAINFAGGGNKLVLQAGSILTGNVVSTSGATNGGDTLALGGTVNASGGNSFNLSNVGSNAKFRGFQQFAKEDTSTWTLTGTGAGNWNVAAGTLNFADAMALTGAVTVASGATLASGTSLVTGSVSNGGMLSIAAGKTLSITGNFSNTGTFRPTLVDTAVGKVVATGAVAIGGNLFVDAAQLTAASTYNGRVNGVIVGSTRTGAFAQVADNSVLFDFTPVYSATGVDLTYATPGAPAPTPGPIPGPAPAPAPAPSGVADAVRAAGGTFGPAIGAAVALDTIINANPGGAIGSALLPLTTQRQVAIAASQTTPLLTGATTQATQTILDTINRLIQARNELNRGQSSGDEFLGNKAAWIKPFGSRARQGTRDNVEGYKANTAGLAAGIDGATSPTMRVGGAFVYAKSDVDSKSTVAPQSASINVYQLVGYGSLNLDPATNLDFQLDVGRNQNSGRRSIGFASTTANSSYDSQTAHAGVAVGRKLTIDSQTTLTPSLRADYTAIKDKAYSETGAGALGLNVDGRTARTFVIGADGKLAHQLNEQTLLLANLGLGYDTINDRNTITSTFAGGPGVAFTTYGIKPSPWMMRAGLGVVYLAKNGAEITGRYDAEHRSSFVNQTISVKARWPF